MKAPEAQQKSKVNNEEESVFAVAAFLKWSY